jgi:hypothetical protein
VSWPTGPPLMPSPGWYSDPEQASTWRWWDGTGWTELRSPMWEQPTHDRSTSFSAWFDRSFSGVKAVLRRFGLVVFGAWATVGLVAAVVVVAALESDRGRELRGLLDDELTTGLTDAEADRAWTLVGELVWSMLPWGIAVVLAYAVVAAWSYALAAQVAATGSGSDARALVGQDASDRSGADGIRPSARVALGRVPMVIAASVALGSIALGVLAGVSLPVVLVVISEADGAAIGLTVFFSVIAGLVIGVWLWVRLALTVVVAALGGHGLGIQRSWALTNGRSWFVFGRVLVAGLIAGALGGAMNLVSNFFGLAGVVVGVSLVLVLTAVVDALRTIVSAAAHAVIVDQLEATSD